MNAFREKLHGPSGPNLFEAKTLSRRGRRCPPAFIAVILALVLFAGATVGFVDSHAGAFQSYANGTDQIADKLRPEFSKPLYAVELPASPRVLPPATRASGPLPLWLAVLPELPYSGAFICFVEAASVASSLRPLHSFPLARLARGPPAFAFQQS